jgi:hypothetical protein
MQGHSSIIIKSMVACLAVLGGAGIGGLAAGFNARTALPARPAASAAITTLSPSEAVNLRFPAHWSEAAAEEAAPRKVVLASADPGMVLFRPSLTYPVAAPPVAAAAPAAAEPPEKPKPTVAAKPPAPKPVHRSNAVLNEAQIASIKRRLNLTPDQERYWPAVEAELRKMEYAKRATAGAAGGSTRTASVDMSKVNVEGLKSAGYPLVMSFSDDQRRELRSLVHLLGLENVMAGI